jgi:cysteine desulfurase
VQPIYLDYNATTPIAEEVRDAMLPYLSEQFGNPSSSHALGRRAKAAVETARGEVADMLGAEPDEIIFTSGGTEANNLAILGTAFARARRAAGHLIISAMEHPATAEPARLLEQIGFRVTRVKPTSDGVVKPSAVEAAIQPDTLLVSLIHANNEIGTIQPIESVAAICRRRGIALHADAAQSVGKIPTRVAELGVDLLSLAGHKFYAPKGIGALYVRRGTPLEPALRGAGQERGLRPGTENVASIVGLGRAAQRAGTDLPDVSRRLTALRDRLWQRLHDFFKERLVVHGGRAARLPNTLSVAFPSLSGADVLQRIPELCASTGAACHSDTVQISDTLAAIGVAPDVARRTVRLSVGRYTSEAEVDRAAELICSVWQSTQGPGMG